MYAMLIFHHIGSMVLVSVIQTADLYPRLKSPHQLKGRLRRLYVLKEHSQ